jgi:hypothetical protein
VTQSVEDIIQAAHAVVYDLLRTKVTAHDVEAALERRCNGWPEQDRDAALRLAVEFAQIKGDAVLEAMDASHQNMGQMEHYCSVADELGDHLDLPVAYVWSDEDRERGVDRVQHRH